MVAAQVLLGLWATGLAVAAPQLDFGDSRSVGVLESRGAQAINQNQVVSDVVSALQPSIEAAIAEALASLRSNSVSNSVFSSGSSGLAATGGATAAVQEPARYNYEYKVADSDAQNYISKSEERDGDTLTGSYSYVDPNGDLVTVNYEAGPMGYSAVTEKQEGFVKIRKQSSASSSASGFTGATSGGFSTTSTTSTTSTASSSAVDQSDLIARIIASLQPQITTAVQSALASSSSSTGLVRETNRVATGRSSAARDLAGTFGNGVSVNIDTPEYNINY